MIFDSVVVGPLGVNCYLIGCNETNEGIVVDPGANADRILSRVAELGITVKYIVNTHGHFDHVGANKEVVTATGGELLIHAEDAPMLTRAAQVAAMYGVTTENSPPPDRNLEDGMLLQFGKCQAHIIHTPGHTRGGCCLYFASDKKVITGDTLFADSIGRTDLPGGSHETILDSIRRKLFVLPEETVVYPGHGPSTTIGTEKRDNPYF